MKIRKLFSGIVVTLLMVGCSAPEEPTSSAQVESVIGEEDGGVGTLAAIERGYRADGAIIMEPTDLAICPAQAGAVNFRITVRQVHR